MLYSVLFRQIHVWKSFFTVFYADNCLEYYTILMYIDIHACVHVTVYYIHVILHYICVMLFYIHIYIMCLVFPMPGTGLSGH